MAHSAEMHAAPVLKPDIQDDIRESLTTIRNQRTRERTLAVATLVFIFLAIGAFVYLAYSSEPGSMRPIPASQP
jgi:hypothetical protein